MARVGNTSVPSRASSEFGKTATIIAVGCLIGALFAGSTVATPLYVIYKQQLGFSQITLTLISGPSTRAVDRVMLIRAALLAQ